MTRRGAMLLAAITAFAAAVRFCGIGFGLRHTYARLAFRRHRHSGDVHGDARVLGDCCLRRRSHTLDERPRRWSALWPRRIDEIQRDPRRLAVVRPDSAAVAP